KKKIGLIGHSEGGMIAPMVATSRKDIDFIVLLAAPGVRITELMAEQNAAILRSSGLSIEAVSEAKKLFKLLVSTIRGTSDSATALQQVSMAMENWKAKQADSILIALELSKPEKRKEYISVMTNQLQGPWFRYFMNFDPKPYLEQLNCKVLALNGSRDIQVISSQNLPGIEAALKRSKAKAVTLKELPGLNHLFQSCNACTIDEYGLLEETFSPAALLDMSNWLNKNVK
ncbi:MAG TPA: acyl-CoA thioester hydrolase/BAAT C-terminal domain-containing protein, partial [Chitinophagaceae bacterium]|nr:acyl-CoA thioester hydrolase/BAAT C-terminal domain-containing protein [Chitinophagaceae bacterium]